MTMFARFICCPFFSANDHMHNNNFNDHAVNDELCHRVHVMEHTTKRTHNSEPWIKLDEKHGYQKLDDLDTAIFLSQNHECPICLDAEPMNDFIAIIPCGHVFHQKCLNDWFAKTIQQNNCPFCGNFVKSVL